ncbi:MAG: VanW family protein [Eubacteriales bacterium]|nr:VanW family protein [Eubacteriales bacterium]
MKKHKLITFFILFVTLITCLSCANGKPNSPVHINYLDYSNDGLVMNMVELELSNIKYRISDVDDEAVLIDQCNALAAIHSAESVNAELTATDSFESPYQVTKSVAGYSVTAEEILSAISASNKQTIMLAADTIEPDVTTDSLIEHNSLISQYTTSFSKSTLSKTNRIFNITKAASLIDGVVVEPNEVFSINDTIGDRNRKNGWKKAAAISGGTYVEEYGGGVCQVSSTLFNAVLMADLEIVERHHHSWPMSYVPIGRDATISTGIKDFRFKNNTEYPITIFTNVDEENKELCICIYGTKSEQYDYIEVESERVGYEDKKPTEYRLDETLPAGTKVVEREGRRGKRSVTYKLYYSADGELIDKVVAHKDTYASISEIVYLSADLYY